MPRLRIRLDRTEAQDRKRLLRLLRTRFDVTHFVAGNISLPISLLTVEALEAVAMDELRRWALARRCRTATRANIAAAREAARSTILQAAE